MGRNLILLVGVLVFLIILSIGLGTSSRRAVPAPAPTPEAQDAPVWEGTGTTTLGCSLWNPPTRRDYDEPRSLRYGDFYIEGTSERIVIGYAGTDGIYLIDGLYCGISIDWRGFPDAPVP
jgi:hypothetical protein